MHTLRQIFNRQKKAVILLLALFVIGWAFTEFKTVFGGLILGSMFGLYNFFILVRRMERFDQKILEGKETKSVGGTVLRFASGVAAAAIALSMPEKFNLIATVIGLMIPYVLLLVDRIVVHVKQY
ncbi:ATP synthase subunit I [Sporosarcina sp. ACRSL]|uniref:ATP synthase subunit I n=1 Tax=Sporosarcina sp. ACRSL TaxID=2918215 RepID=UPI001EF50AD9|nr:ATP synthase subunit I [Sporosarcina sp. ACRSL]MCG7343910.1 ATP synthase subunit I [Sporosarcina sp. ACRSL]